MIQPMTNRIKDLYSDMPQAPFQAIQGAFQSARTAISDRPEVAVMTAFVLGVGIGIGIAGLLHMNLVNSSRA